MIMIFRISTLEINRGDNQIQNATNEASDISTMGSFLSLYLEVLFVHIS